MTETECIICLDRCPVLKFIPCQHQCCCVQCYVRLPNVNPHQCPLCRAHINSVLIIGTFSGPLINIFMNDIVPQNDNQEMYIVMKFFLRKNRSGLSTGKIILMIVNIFRDFNPDDYPQSLLTVDQCQELITFCQERGYMAQTDGGYRLYHMFVAMCRQPWDIPTEIGLSGSCYFGNFGEQPELLGGIGLIKSNYMMCRSGSFQL